MQIPVDIKTLIIDLLADQIQAGAILDAPVLSKFDPGRDVGAKPFGRISDITFVIVVGKICGDVPGQFEFFQSFGYWVPNDIRFLFFFGQGRILQRRLFTFFFLFNNRL